MKIKKRGRKLRPGAIRLYKHLVGLVESGRNQTNWHTTDQICQYLFSALTTKNMEKTRGAIGVARKMLKETHDKFFYHTETDGYVVLKNVNQHREIIKRHTAIADGFRLTADYIFQVASASLPELKKLFNETQVKQIKSAISYGIANIKNKSVESRPQSTKKVL